MLRARAGGPFCRNEVGALEREIDSLKRQVDAEHKKADELMRERDLLNRLKTQAENATHKQASRRGPGCVDRQASAMSFSRSLSPAAGDPGACQRQSSRRAPSNASSLGLTFFSSKNPMHFSTQLLSSGIIIFCCHQHRFPLPTLPLPYLQLDLIKINDNSKRNLEQELNGYKLDAQKQAKQIWALEREREAYGAQVSPKSACQAD